VKRRAFISLLGGAAAAWPLAARAQQPMPVIGFLSGASPGGYAPYVAAFRQSLIGNVTGSTTLSVEVGPKRLELAHELFPRATTFALLVNPANPLAATVSKDFQAVADTLGLRLHVLHASTEADFETAFATAAQLRAAALVISTPDPWFNSHAAQLGALALRHSVPAIFQYRAFAAAGGLMSYGGVITDTYRLAGVYTGRILKGEKPADLPVVQSTRVELILNLKTAKALGITVPLPLSGRADEVIE
jgi:putative tryptophan/tyrosine transport system substrate-binding protein